MKTSIKYAELIKKISSPDKNIRANAYNQLWSLEENNELSSKEMLDLLEIKENPSINIYAIEGLGRLNDQNTYKPLLKIFEKTDDNILLEYFLDTFTKIESSFFEEAVLNKIGYKINLFKNLKRDDKYITLSSTRDYLFVGILKYLKTSATEISIPVLLDALKHVNQSIRWNALLVFKERDLPLNAETLKEIEENDESEIIRRQAKLILDLRENKTVPLEE